MPRLLEAPLGHKGTNLAGDDAVDGVERRPPFGPFTHAHFEPRCTVFAAGNGKLVERLSVDFSFCR